VIPAQDYDYLFNAGAKAVFGPGTRIEDSAARCWKKSARHAADFWMNLHEAPLAAQAQSLSPVDQALVDGVLAGQRRALAKAITLIESTRSDHQQRAQQVLNACCRVPVGPSVSVFPVCRGRANQPSSRRLASG
jgi:hypothetical protein